MNGPVAEWRRAICLAVRNAQRGCKTRRWLPLALERLHRDFGTDIRQDAANQLFDAFVLNLNNRVKIKRPPPGYEEDFIFDCVVPSSGDRVFFEFTLFQDDPEFPEIVIVSAHRSND